MKRIIESPLYLAALVIGGLATVVGAVTVMTGLQGQEGVPEGGSVITLLVGVTILALALTGPSEPTSDADGPLPGASREAEGTDGEEASTLDGPGSRGAPATGEEERDG